MDRPSWPALIRALIGGRALTAEQTAWAMNEIMEGAATPAQIAGFGVALRAKGETAEEMAGLAASMLAHATPITILGPVTDLVGTGGDGLHTVNVSTMATIVAASAGVPMVKHGNRAASSACGAADVLEALGVVIDLPAAATEALFGEIGIAFLFAAMYHPALPARRPGAQGTRRADGVQLPGAADQPGPAHVARGRRRRPDDGPGAGRGVRRAAASRPWCSTARASTSSPRPGRPRSGSPPTAR